jgi:Flp pilus assembly pilin Flp
MWKLFKLLRRFSKNKRGATALEYGLVSTDRSWLLILSKVITNRFPNVRSEVIKTTATREQINPYSRAVAPRLFFENRRRSLNNFHITNLSSSP